MALEVLAYLSNRSTQIYQKKVQRAPAERKLRSKKKNKSKKKKF